MAKKRKDLWKIPQALLSTISTWLLVTTNLGASPSSPKFTSYFHFYFHFLPKIPGSPKAEENLLICITPDQRKPSTHPRALLLLCNIPDKNNCWSDLVHHQLGRGQDVIQGLRGIEPGMVQHPLNGQAFLRFDLQQPGEEGINPY